MTTDQLTAPPIDVVAPALPGHEVAGAGGSAETAAAPRPASHRRPRGERSRSLTAWLLALGGYLPLAGLAFWPVWTHWSAQLNGCNCWDQVALEWWVRWTPSALAHGHSVFVTNYLDGPGGINMMWNTSVPALGAAAAPLTETVGVVHAMAIVLTLSLALSASTMFVLLRRWVGWWPAAWIGGLVYGFSAFAVEEAGVGRLIFAFAAIPPLIVLALDKLRRREWSALTCGAVVGVLGALQLLVSEEILAITAILLGLALIVLGVRHHREVLARRADVLKALAASAVGFVVLAGYPLWVQFTGADRINGPPQSRAQIALFSSDLLSLITPGKAQWLDPGWTRTITDGFGASLASEVTEYVGLPLLVFAIATVVVLRRRTLVRVFAGVAVASFALSLGPRLLVDNHDTGVPGPYVVLTHLPIVGDIIPSRFALGLWFSLAVLFAVGLTEVRARLEQYTVRRRQAPNAGAPERLPSSVPRRRTTNGVAGWGAALLGLCILLPTMPNWPYGQRPADVPAFFNSAAVHAVPAGSLALTYPYPLSSTAWPMLWQADAGMRFRMLGGYVIAPDPHGNATVFGDQNPLENCLTTVYASGARRGRSAPRRSCGSGSTIWA